MLVFRFLLLSIRKLFYFDYIKILSDYSLNFFTIIRKIQSYSYTNQINNVFLNFT